MKIRLCVGALLATTVIGGPFAQTAQDRQYADVCRKYAKEDGVPAAEINDYIQQCVQDLSGTDPEGPPPSEPVDQSLPK